MILHFQLSAILITFSINSSACVSALPCRPLKVFQAKFYCRSFEARNHFRFIVLKHLIFSNFQQKKTILTDSLTIYFMRSKFSQWQFVLSSMHWGPNEQQKCFDTSVASSQYSKVPLSNSDQEKTVEGSDMFAFATNQVFHYLVRDAKSCLGPSNLSIFARKLVQIESYKVGHRCLLPEQKAKKFVDIISEEEQKRSWKTKKFFQFRLCFVLLNFPFVCPNISACLKRNRLWLVIVYCHDNFTLLAWHAFYSNFEFTRNLSGRFLVYSQIPNVCTCNSVLLGGGQTKELPWISA